MGWRDTIASAATPNNQPPPASSGWRSTIKAEDTKDPSWLDTKLPFDTTPRGFIKGAAEQLPTVGAIGGGLIGSGAGPVGTIGGAGLGYAGGESLKNVVNKAMGEDVTRDDVWRKPAEGLVKGATYEMGGQVLGELGSMAANSRPGKWAGGLISKTAKKVGSGLTGVPEKEIGTYANHADEINAMSKASDNNVAAAADDIRGGFNESIQSTRRGLNDEIGGALKGNTEIVNGNKIIDALKAERAKIDPDLYPEQLQQIDDLASKVLKKMDGEGNLFAQDANSIKQFLQDKAKTAYQQTGDIFPVGKEAAKAAKGGAATARGLVNESIPAVKNANSKLADLHDIEDLINPNLIAEGKPEAALLAAGSGNNQRSAGMLKKLGELTNTDMLTQAEKLAAMRTFGKPALLPIDTTGKSMTRLGVGGGVGAAAGLLTGIPGAAFVGGAAGSAATSPMALKKMIDLGLWSSKQVKSMMGTPAGRQLLVDSYKSTFGNGAQ